MMILFWVCIVRHDHNTQKNKFTISLQHLTENVKDKVDFLPADKCLKFLQNDTIILGVCGHALSKITSSLFLFNILKRK